ncbi:hypothetical protein CEUSTIGMA_g6548.t1 [Chlamydomonas eustigma]|uniref:BZIP domain-containing protein n=1 Tax=Chlamydomonas eustigma TaxID=1157962 RepID=A0A250X7P9_9CHLO|nr:hypothetical protein CEUSTIGMA_g6548.t1 [Chlamydomonas eustigma]|eukprot:GAX79108.1 hypothetical protein CEUSTIGMA_g6548.t1 [Chlamydomonas eustigma]
MYIKSEDTMSSSPVTDEVLKQFIESDVEEEKPSPSRVPSFAPAGSRDALFQLTNFSNNHVEKLSNPEEQLQHLQLQLQEHQQLLNHLKAQQDNSQPVSHKRSSDMLVDVNEIEGAGALGVTSSDGRRAARRAASVRQRTQITELESKLQNVASMHLQLQEENNILRRRMKLLESGVQMREQHLAILMKAREQQQNEHKQQASGFRAPVLDSNVPAGDSPSTSGFSHAKEEYELACTRDTTNKGSVFSNTAMCGIQERLEGVLGDSDSWGPIACSEPTPTYSVQQPAFMSDAKGDTNRMPCGTSFTFFANPAAWSTSVSNMIKKMTPREYQKCWTEFVKEVSMLALSSQAHGLDTEAHLQLVKVVTTCLEVTDHIIALNPAAYYSSMYVNLLTGQSETPPKEYWRRCVQRVKLEPEQVQYCKTAMEEHSRKMAGVMTERTQIASDLSQRLAQGPGYAVERYSQPAVQAAAETSDLAQRLHSNVQKEFVNNSFVIDFLTMQVLTPLQIALLCAASFPFMPDPTAMAEAGLDIAGVELSIL